jgi:hypothetical protein
MINKLPLEIRAMIYKKLDINSLFRLGEANPQFIPGILDLFPKRKWIHFWFVAAEEGYCNWLHKLIPLVNTSSKKFCGKTALHIVTNNNNLKCLNVLIQAGVNVEIADDYDGRTALHYAAHFGDVVVLKQLIKAGADVNVKDNRGETPLRIATNYNNFDCVRVLMKCIDKHKC